MEFHRHHEIATLKHRQPAGIAQKTREIEDLRAIPWVFSWAQCRLMLPGLVWLRQRGRCLDRSRSRQGHAVPATNSTRVAVLPHAVVEQDMVLAKKLDRDRLALRRLVPDEALREKIFGRIRQEWQTSIECCWTSWGRSACCRAILARTARSATFPYLDSPEPRPGGALEGASRANPDEQVLRGIQLTSTASRAGLRNSG